MDDSVVARPPTVDAPTERKQTARLKDARDRITTFRSGMLLFRAATRKGKSITAAGLVYTAGLHGIKAGYRTWDEPGSLTPTPLSPVTNLKTMATTSGADGPFKTSTTALGALSAEEIVNSYFKDLRDYIRAGSLNMCVIDSIGGLMSSAAGLVDVPALKGGMVQGYSSVLHALDTLGILMECTIIGLLNDTLFPVGDMEGATDGVITLSSQGVFLKRDRANRSDPDPFELSPTATDRAFALLEPGRKAARLATTITQGII